MSIEEVRNKLALIIADNLDISVEEVVFGDDFLDTLGITSLKFMLMLSDIEAEFGIYVPEAEMRKFTTPNYVVNYIFQAVNI